MQIEHTVRRRWRKNSDPQQLTGTNRLNKLLVVRWQHYRKAIFDLYPVNLPSVPRALQIGNDIDGSNMVFLRQFPHQRRTVPVVRIWRGGELPLRYVGGKLNAGSFKQGASDASGKLDQISAKVTRNKAENELGHSPMVLAPPLEVRSGKHHTPLIRIFGPGKPEELMVLVRVTPRDHSSGLREDRVRHPFRFVVSPTFGSIQSIKELPMKANPCRLAFDRVVDTDQPTELTRGESRHEPLVVVRKPDGQCLLHSLPALEGPESPLPRDQLGQFIASIRHVDPQPFHHSQAQ